MTISRALDYLIDVFSCSPEQLRLAKTEQSILEDERTSRLMSKYYGADTLAGRDQYFALVLWNDEKHTVNDVKDQVARACKQKEAFGLAKAYEVDEIGRSAIRYSKDIGELLRMAKIIEEINLTVTIRSARDTFREQMAGTIVDWISDISGCSVGDDAQILRRTVCEELLKQWRIGSEASHRSIGKDGLDDHEGEEGDSGSDFLAQFIRIQRLRARAERRERQQSATNDDAPTDEDETEDQNMDGESAQEAAMNMEIDELLAQDHDGDVDMEAFEHYDSPDEALEISEATIAGYPPPPPPPPGAHQTAQTMTPTESDGESMTATLGPSHVEPSMMVPQTPRNRPPALRSTWPPKYWLEKPEGYARKPGMPAHEDIWQRLRLDYLVLYDLRMWKQLRIALREVFISTVVTIPEFKRLLGLRFAGVYTALAQLYLIADREPDHSIINLSLQMVTTPSITAEIVERGNFLTNLMAILYTFLTTRQVGYPWDVDPNATLAFEQGAVTNRRMYHFFVDMKYLLASEYVQDRIREEPRYLLQFLDLVKLHQGICPNVRAVGEHLEYETEAWLSASLITREINRLCRQFSEAFRWNRDEDPTNICRAIRAAAKVAIVNSTGAERKRFDQAELRHEVQFKSLAVFDFDADPSSFLGSSYRIVDYVVAKEPMSFYHGLHYVLSWLIDRARSMPRDHVLGLLLFSCPELQEPRTGSNTVVPDLSTEEYLLALFDFPLRVCAWLSQMRAGIWVRNGISLRHQMTQYRSVSQRDISYQRDIFLLQSALVLCNPSVFLATMIDRFGLLGWMTGKYDSEQHGFEDAQAIQVVEDFVHLLIILLSDRTHLVPVEDDVDPHITAIRREIAHVLCFKPLSYSEMTNRLSDKVQNADEFSDVLDEMTTFRPPEGLSDSGTFALKEHYIELVDPYMHQYTQNQREEAESIFKNYMAKKTGKPAGDIIFEPKLRPIPSGLFQNLADFTRQPLFTQIIYYLLGYALVAETATPSIPATRVETYIQFVLQLLLVAILEDNSEQHEWSQPAPNSFVTSVLTKRANMGLPGHPTVLSILKSLLEKESFKACEPKIKLIMHRLKQKQQSTFIVASEALHLPVDRVDTASPASLSVQEKELKKKQALERQARVMASFKEQQGKFMANQAFDWGEEEEDDLEDEPTDREKIAKYPSGTCIYCQEETNEQRLYGSFGYVSESSILRLTDLQDDDWIEEVTDTPTSLDRSAESIRPFGVAGKNKREVVKTNADGEKVTTIRQDLGKGFPRHCIRRGPLSSGCGHIMHYSCFETYLQATQRRHVSQIARNHPERPEVKEFICPLCKALGNMFLPIIWKGQRMSYPGALETQTSFDDWMGSQVGISISKLDKREASSAERRFPMFQKTLLDYGTNEFIDSVVGRLPEIMKPMYINMPAPQPPAAHQFTIPAFLPVPHEDGGRAVLSPDNSPAPVQNFSMLELVMVYQRLRDTFRTNSIPSTFSQPATPATAVEDLTHTDSLAQALGFSISAVEIAQRGVDSDSPRGTLLDKISPQTLTHLRVYSETVSSYLAIGCLRNQGSTRTMDEYVLSQSKQIHDLFAGHPNVFCPSALSYDMKNILPLLAQDPFIFLSELSVFAVPAFNLDIQHVMRLCYMAEVVRVMLAFIIQCCRLDSTSSSKPDELPPRFPDISKLVNPAKVNMYEFSEAQLGNLSRFAGCIYSLFVSDQTPDAMVFENWENSSVPEPFKDPLILYFLYTMASTYALTFVRKAAILMHVRYGVEFPQIPFEQIDLPELERLSSLLKLPSLHEMFADFGSDSPGGYATRYTVAGWIRHWMWSREGKRPSQQLSIGLSHPAIFELIGLPKNYDSLTDEAIRRKCPTTGKDLTDPALCLFCGEIMCSQAVCCMEMLDGGGRGGCNQHQEKYVIPYSCFLLSLPSLFMDDPYTNCVCTDAAAPSASSSTSANAWSSSSIIAMVPGPWLRTWTSMARWIPR
jgi:E3 ubiquitin-protein ligase UBR1